MTKRTDQRPATVPFAATQAGEPPSVRSGPNRAVWTERMLTALEQGVQGGKWLTLIDKVYSRTEPRTRPAVRCWATKGRREWITRRSSNSRIDNWKNCDDWRRSCGRNVSAAGGPARVDSQAGEHGTATVGDPTVRDRVVQTALRHVLEPIFDVTFAEHSYGFRPGRGCHDALERVEALLKEGYVYVVDADLKSYFDTIPQDRLMDRVRERVADSRVLRLVETFLEQGVMDGLSEWTPETGTPQGAVISPLLANIYLNPLDHLMAEAGFAMVRYADDFVILCRSRAEAERALAVVRQLGRGQRPDAASDQDADRGRTDGRL